MGKEMKLGIIFGVVIVVVLAVLVVVKDSRQEASPEIILPQDNASNEVTPQLPDTLPVAIEQATDDAEPCTTAVTEEASGESDEKPTDGAVDDVAEHKIEPVISVEPQPDETTPRYYVVKKGDTLSDISEEYYGHGKFWRAIWQANDSLIAEPDRLQPGWRLRIPYPDEIEQKKQ